MGGEIRVALRCTTQGLVHALGVRGHVLGWRVGRLQRIGKRNESALTLALSHEEREHRKRRLKHKTHPNFARGEC